MRIANAPLSYGVFEETAGLPGLPGPDEILREIAAAGYAGTELGPPGFLGEGDGCAARLDGTAWSCAAAGASSASASPTRGTRTSRVLRAHARRARGARASTGRAPGVRRRRLGGAAREPGRRRDDPSLALDDAGWARFADGLRRAEEIVARARLRAGVPRAHEHVRGGAGRDRPACSTLTDMGLLVDSGHLLLGGSDPVQAVRDWGSARRLRPPEGRAARHRPRGRRRAGGRAGGVAARHVLRAGRRRRRPRRLPRRAARDRLRRLDLRRAGPHPARGRAARRVGGGAGQEPRVAAARAGF